MNASSAGMPLHMCINMHMGARTFVWALECISMYVHVTASTGYLLLHRCIVAERCICARFEHCISGLVSESTHMTCANLLGWSAKPSLMMA